jgi:hypothetical protein
MACTTVTGRGLGSADKRQKGSEHDRLGAEKLIGPRAVAIGTVTLDGSGVGSVILPVLTGTTSNYLVLCTDTNTSAAAAVGASLAISASATTLSIKGTASHVIQYGVFKVGLAV